MTDIEPIHELPEDDLQHILDAIREPLSTLYGQPNMTPRKMQGAFEQQIDSNLKALVQSTLKSLVDFYPKEKETLSELADANETWWLQQTLEKSRMIPKPLFEGITALLKVYSLLETYKTDYRPEDTDDVFFDFREMELAIKKYVAVAIGPFVRAAHNFKKTQAIKAKKPRNRNGMSPADRKKRNEEIKKHFKKASGQGKITPNGFAQKYTKKYAISPSQIREIINS